MDLIHQYVRQGAAAGALFVIVMYAILMPKGSRLQRTLMGLRGESAIMASFLLLPHNLYYGIFYGNRLLKQSAVLNLNEWIALFCSVIMFLLLIPLTVTSFPKIRRRMKPKKWKQLQRWSYLFYGLMYLHVAALTFPRAWDGSTTALNTFFVYTILYGVYAGLRLRKALIKRNRRRQGNAVMTTLFALSVLLGGLCFWHNLRENVREEKAEEVSLQESQSSPEIQEGGYPEGTWKGTGTGFQGEITVEVTVEAGKISSIRILESVDDEEYLSAAAAGMKKRIIEAQSPEVDVVSGATYSSKGISEAVEAALKQAQLQTFEQSE